MNLSHRFIWPSITLLFVLVLGCYETPVPVLPKAKAVFDASIIGEYERQSLPGKLVVKAGENQTYDFRYTGDDGRNMHGNAFVVEYEGLNIAHSKTKGADGYDLITYTVKDGDLHVRLFRTSQPVYESSEKLRAYISRKSGDLDIILEPVTVFKRVK